MEPLKYLTHTLKDVIFHSTLTFEELFDLRARKRLWNGTQVHSTNGFFTLNKMADMLQAAFSKAFSWQKNCIFWLRFRLIFSYQIGSLNSLRPSYTHIYIYISKIIIIGLDNGLLPSRR